MFSGILRIDGDEMEDKEYFLLPRILRIIRAISINQKAHNDGLMCYMSEYKPGMCEVLFVLSTIVLISR